MTPYRVMVGALLLLLALAPRAPAASVTFAWDAGAPCAGCATPDGYVLARDGVDVVRTPVVQATDRLPGPGRFTYTVQAVAGTARSDPSAPLTLTAAALACTLVQTPDALTVTCPTAGPPPGPYPLLPLGSVTVRRVDSEETGGENGRAVNALDGQAATLWHTQWLGAAPPFPHTLTLDLGAVRWVDGLRYLPRQDGSRNGTLTEVRVETSLDAQTWTVAAQSTWAGDATAKTTRFAAGRARYVQLVALAGLQCQPWAAAAEVGVYAVEATP